MHDATRAVMDNIASEAKKEGLGLEYLFVNDASYNQDIIGHYGEENVKRLKEVQRVYDPNRVLQRLVAGGFKL